ncbi:hypothetical protein PINS_up002343 [Pythium insidiosum]|nr:hypothetical protein PINS_up002343 [Pythium insidiosum]
MLTGVRVRGALLNDDALLALLPIRSPEHAFASLLLRPTTTLNEVCAHRFALVQENSHPDGRLQFRDLVQELLDKECSSCDDQLQRDTRDLTAWHAQFEKRYQRPPTPQDLPSSVRRLQARCRVIQERRAMLQQRLRVIHQSVRPPLATSSTSSSTSTSDARTTSQSALGAA